jgi:CRP/FNR family transcriptional regulator, nitrogen oxide reductase regulator
MENRKRIPLRPETIDPHQCSVDVRLRILGRVPFFGGLSAEELAGVNRLFREHGYAPGQAICYAGDKATHLFVVANGKVKLMRQTADGQEVLLDILVRGDFFGSLSALGDATYPDTAQAQTRCCVLAISAADFQAVLRRHPAVALATLDILAGRLRSAHTTIGRLSAYPVESRLAATLLKLAEQLGEPRGNEILIQMPLSRQDLAAMTGTTTETVSRLISQFRAQGLVHTGRQWVALTNPAGLAALAPED